MTTKITGFGEDDDYAPEAQVAPVNYGVGQLAQVTPSMVDEAAEAALRNIDEPLANAIRLMWKSDPNTAVATKWFSDQVEARQKLKMGPLGKTPFTVREALTTEEAQLVTRYAPEYDIKFASNQSNEHSVFSARRVIDHALLKRKIPNHETYLDIGGSVLSQVRHERSQCVTVSPFNIDKKDPVRATMMKLAIKKIASSATSSAIQRDIAVSILQGDERYHVPSRAQDCVKHANFSMAVHVYDIPIEEWPLMMERCDIKIHTGCLHFSNEILSSDSGEIPQLGSYYEIDRSKDLFRMRVGRSSAEWYEHKFSDYLRYGVQQVLSGKKNVYMYEITERRQDTIFYRIMKMDGEGLANYRQVYRLPGIRMVRVRGFEVFRSKEMLSKRKSLKRRMYEFPAVLWERMVSFCTAEIARSGNVSSEKAANYYRTLVPKQSINAVVFAGGESVDITQIPALVVLAGVVAHMDVVRAVRTVRVHTDALMRERDRYVESTMFKGLMAFIDSVGAMGAYFSTPLTPKMNAMYDYMTQGKMVSWTPVPIFCEMSMAMFVDHKRLSYVSESTPDDSGFDRKPDMIDTAIAYARAHKKSNSGPGGFDTCELDEDIEDKMKTESTLGGETVVGSEASVVVTSWEKVDGKLLRKESFPKETSDVRYTRRRLAVEEAVIEVETEIYHISDAAQRLVQEVLPLGQPKRAQLMTDAERLANPDIWEVKDGLLVKSELGGLCTKFAHMAVFTPAPVNGEQFHPVEEELFVGRGIDGKVERRVYYRLVGAGQHYSGYAVTFDPLKILTGPAMLETMKIALTLDPTAYDFDVHCHEGPPGCGKTTSIVNMYKSEDDVVLTPTRLSALEIRDRLGSVHNLSERVTSASCKTLHSMLVNYTSQTLSKHRAKKRGLFDEYVMAREGMWYAVAALLGLSEVHAFGDKDQLSHKPRVEVPKHYLIIKPEVRWTEYETYRNPPKIVAAWNPIKSFSCRTSKPNVGIVARVNSFEDVMWEGSVRLVSMHQKDKIRLQEVARGLSCKPIISTVHEAQGLDCDTLVLYNSERRVRGKQGFYLYNMEDYVFVAMSRVKKNFFYVSDSPEVDLVMEAIARANNPLHIQVAMDVPTIGKERLAPSS